MSVAPYIQCAGNCREMVETYARAFGIPVGTIMTYAEMPGEMGQNLPEGLKDLVAHAELEIHGTTIGFSDHFPVSSAVIGNNVGLIVTLADENALTGEFAALSEGGKVEMPLAPTFWAKWYGVLTDRFGVPWQFMVLPQTPA